MLRTLRRVLSALLLTSLLAALAGAAWLTHHPESPWVERAAGWRVVGPLAARFRAAYLPPPAAPVERREAQTVVLVMKAPPPVPDDGGGESAGRTEPALTFTDGILEPTRRFAQPRSETGAEPGGVGGGTESAGLPAPVDGTAGFVAPAPAAAERIESADLPAAPVAAPVRQGLPDPQPVPAAIGPPVWLLPGTALRNEPRSDARPEGRLVQLAQLPRLAEDDGWVRVAFAGRALWAPLDAAAEAERAHRDEKAARRWRHGGMQDRAFLAGRRLFGRGGFAGTVGPYALFSDDSGLGALDEVDRAAQHVVAAYVERYRVEPSGWEGGLLFVFSAEEIFRRYATAIGSPHAATADGISAGSVAATFAADRSPLRLTTTVLHELTHQLNRRCFAERPPRWLEEGVATDLGHFWSEVSTDVRRPGALGTVGVELGRFRGAAQGASELPLAELLALDPEEFYARPHGYDRSFVFVRYLLDGEGGALRSGFHAFLAGLARGRRAWTDDLLRHLGRDLPALEAGLAAFTAGEVRRREELFARLSRARSAIDSAPR